MKYSHVNDILCPSLGMDFTQQEPLREQVSLIALFWNKTLNLCVSEGLAMVITVFIKQPWGCLEISTRSRTAVIH